MMATSGIAESYEDSVYRSSVDVKVPTTLELPVDDWPQQVTDILSPDLITGEADSAARQLGHENGVVGMISSSNPIEALSTETSTNLPATTESGLNTSPEDSLPTTLPATTEAGLNTAPKDSLPSTHEDSLPLIDESSLPSTHEDSLPSTHETSLPSIHKSSHLSTPETSLPSTSDIGSPKTQPALSPDNDVSLFEKPVAKLALRILDIIQRYGHSTGAGTGVDWAGKNKFLPLVEQSIEKNEPVKMVLPAFPCVSVFNCRPF